MFYSVAKKQHVVLNPTAFLISLLNLYDRLRFLFQRVNKILLIVTTNPEYNLLIESLFSFFPKRENESMQLQLYP